jgi:hypothetical protein
MVNSHYSLLIIHYLLLLPVSLIPPCPMPSKVGCTPGINFPRNRSTDASKADVLEFWSDFTFLAFRRFEPHASGEFS